ncbi:recombinase family protein [Kribbella qitaiheensis]|uniref:Recombinase family protein n=1 Tax=Kribbella qitaiheensis TaxID=1544730 RepID=A0A7G6WY18_9ACTN|nr:recombinase family protein [Kribbella qitaiheensis]QNE18883.1 recombinase family protein [Kribbella qitaiheensis]
MSDKRDDLDLTDEGIPAALDDQIRQMGKRADELGWDVWKVIQNPRLSAYKKRLVTLPDGRREYRVWRPDLREALDDLSSGRADALLALDLDRAFRDPRDLQDLIDVVEFAPHSILVDSVTGSLRLEKGRDNFDAQIRVLVANKSSRDTARRVASARERQARSGKFGGGKRPFGFCAGAPAVPPGRSDVDSFVCPWHGGRDCVSGVSVIEVEARVIEDCSRRLLQGVSLRSMAAELRSGDVPTVRGAAWSAETLRDILLRPRNAGLVVYRGEVLEDVAAPWEPVVEREVFEAVRSLLTDASRRTTAGVAPRWMGTGVYRCGICTPLDADGFPPETDDAVSVKVTIAGRLPRYGCKSRNHLVRNAAHVDNFVQSRVLAALTHPLAYELLDRSAAPEVDTAALRTERAGIRAALDQLAADEVLGLRTRSQVLAGTRAGVARIEQIDAALNASISDDPLTEVVNVADPVAAWEGLPVANKRVIIDRLMTVTILPTGRRGRGFDPASVHIAPKHRLTDQ